MEYYSAMKKNEFLIHVTIDINFKNFRLNERSHVQMLPIVGFHLDEMPRKAKSRESRSVVAWGWRRQQGCNYKWAQGFFPE